MHVQLRRRRAVPLRHSRDDRGWIVVTHVSRGSTVRCRERMPRLSGPFHLDEVADAFRIETSVPHRAALIDRNDDTSRSLARNFWT